MVGLLAQILSLYHTFISFDPPLFFLSHSLFQTISHLLSYNTVYFPFSITHNIFILRGYCTYKSSYYRSNNLSYLHTFSVPVISIKLYSQSHTLTLRSSYSHFVCLSLSLSLSLYLSLSHLSFSIRHTLPPPSSARFLFRLSEPHLKTNWLLAETRQAYFFFQIASLNNKTVAVGMGMG